MINKIQKLFLKYDVTLDLDEKTNRLFGLLKKGNINIEIVDLPKNPISVSIFGNAPSEHIFFKDDLIGLEFWLQSKLNVLSL